MQLAGRYTTMNGLGQQPEPPKTDDEWQRLVATLAKPPSSNCATMQYPCPDGYRNCSDLTWLDYMSSVAPTDLPFGKNTASCEPVPGFKPPGGMVTTQPLGEQKSLPWVLLGIVALMIAWPALRPQYRRGIAA